jgi:uncharacterized membrane protein YuzA (DUF378 family)
MKTLGMIARILVVIGALNWGLVAIGPNFELVQYLQLPWLITLVYALVGLSGLYELVMLFKKK